MRRFFCAKNALPLAYFKYFLYLCAVNDANMKQTDTTHMCSHLQRKLFEGEYSAIREQIESDPTLTAVVRSRQLHIYRDGKKILVLAGKSAPKIIREDKLNQLI